MNITRIEAAAQRLQGHVVETPLLNAPLLDRIAGRQIFVKAESLQVTGSFKARGGWAAVSSLPAGTPGVIAMSSGNHAQGVARAAHYAATKAYVLSLTESLAEELRGSGVTATALCPGITATQMLSHAVAANDHLAQLPRALIGDVGEVAAEGYRACMNGDVICVPGVVNRAATIAARAAPFGHFTAAMRQDTDQFDVTARFKFTHEQTLETTLQADPLASTVQELK